MSIFLYIQCTVKETSKVKKKSEQLSSNLKSKKFFKKQGTPLITYTCMFGAKKIRYTMCNIWQGNKTCEPRSLYL